MEESLFENTSSCTQQIWTELYRKQVKKKLVSTMIMDILIIVIMIIYIVVTNTFIYAGVIIALTIAFSILQFWYLPKKQGKTAYKRAMDLYHSEQRYEAYVYPEHIFLKNVQNKGELDITYDKVKALCDTKHTYLLELKQKSYLMFQKDGFTKGTMLDFVNFIESKGIPRKF